MLCSAFRASSISAKAPAAPFLPVLMREGVTAVDPQTVRKRLENLMGRSSQRCNVMIINEKLVRSHDKDGDSGARRGWRRMKPGPARIG